MKPPTRRPNTGQATFNVTVEDTTPPTVTVPGLITVEGDTLGGAADSNTAIAAFLAGATASDIVDGNLDTSITNDAPVLFPVGVTVVEFSVTDNAGNTATATSTVTVEDTTPPTVTVPSDITAEATSPAGAAVSFTATANDIVDGVLPTTCTPMSGSTFALGSTLVTCEATDTAANTGQATFNVTVEDTTPPTVTVPGLITVEGDTLGGAADSNTAIAAFLAGATASDIVDGNLDTSITNDAPVLFPVGVTVVEFSVTDNAGNTATATSTVTVEDTTPPTVTVPSDITAEATSPAGAAVSFTATANDIVDGVLPTTCTPMSGSTFALGSTLVTCEATDTATNTGQATFNVTVEDTVDPVAVINTPPNGATYTVGQVVNADYTCTDSGSGIDTCNGDVANNTPIDTATTGAKTFTVTATDNAGNTSQTIHNYTVTDGTQCSISGTPGNDLLIGTSGDDVICGFDGHDVIFGKGGNDIILGGPGNDWIEAGKGNDMVEGGSAMTRSTAGPATTLSMAAMAPISSMAGRGMTPCSLAMASTICSAVLVTTRCMAAMTEIGCTAGSGNDVMFGNGGDDRMYGQGGQGRNAWRRRPRQDVWRERQRQHVWRCRRRLHAGQSRS